MKRLSERICLYKGVTVLGQLVYHSRFQALRDSKDSAIIRRTGSLPIPPSPRIFRAGFFSFRTFPIISERVSLPLWPNLDIMLSGTCTS